MSVINRAGVERTATSPWIYDRATDVLIALCWVPLFVVAHQAVNGRGPLGHVSLTTLVELTLLVPEPQVPV